MQSGISTVQWAQKSLGYMFLGSKKATHFFWKVFYLNVIILGPYLLEDNLRTKSMLSFSGPLHFHRNCLNIALFWKWPLDYICWYKFLLNYQCEVKSASILVIVLVNSILNPFCFSLFRIMILNSQVIPAYK